MACFGSDPPFEVLPRNWTRAEFYEPLDNVPAGLEWLSSASKVFIRLEKEKYRCCIYTIRNQDHEVIYKAKEKFTYEDPKEVKALMREKIGASSKNKEPGVVEKEVKESDKFFNSFGRGKRKNWELPFTHSFLIKDKTNRSVLAFESLEGLYCGEEDMKTFLYDQQEVDDRCKTFLGQVTREERETNKRNPFGIETIEMMMEKYKDVITDANGINLYEAELFMEKGIKTFQGCDSLESNRAVISYKEIPTAFGGEEHTLEFPVGLYVKKKALLLAAAFKLLKKNYYRDIDREEVAKSAGC